VIVIEDKELIKKFIEKNHELKTTLADHNITTAQKTYQELYELYHTINNSSLEHIHKEVAYQQIVSAYHSVQDLKQETLAPTNIIAIAIVLIIVSTIIFINPRIIGLAVSQLEALQQKNHAPEWNGQPTTIEVKGETTIDFAPSFKDKDSDQLVYLAIVPQDIQATVSGSIITITPDQGVTGQKTLELVVSDMKNSVRAKIILNIIS